MKACYIIPMVRMGFTPVTRGLNAPRFGSTGLNKAGMNTTLLSHKNLFFLLFMSLKISDLTYTDIVSVQTLLQLRDAIKSKIQTLCEKTKTFSGEQIFLVKTVRMH